MRDPGLGESPRTKRCWICGGPSKPLPAYAPLSLFHCPVCDFAFQPEVESQQVRDSYNSSYFASYGEGSPYSSSEFQRRHEARLRVAFVGRFIPPPGRLLEVGSAAGFFLSEAQAAGWDALGVEPCEEIALQADQRFGTKTVAGFVEDLELEQAAFDLVCGWHVLEHVPSPLASLRKLRAALRAGGYAAFEAPNFGSAYSRRHGPSWQYLDPRHHVGQFTPRALRALFAATGFDSRFVTTVPMFAYVPFRETLRPRQVVHRARYALRTGTTGFGCHPDRFDVLRIIAQVPGEDL